VTIICVNLSQGIEFSSGRYISETVPSEGQRCGVLKEKLGT
jgi:hypothetical protein